MKISAVKVVNDWALRLLAYPNTCVQFFFSSDSNIDEEKFWNNFSKQAVGNKTFFSVSDDLIFDTVSPSHVKRSIKLFISFGDPISRSPLPPKLMRGNHGGP